MDIYEGDQGEGRGTFMCHQQMGPAKIQQAEISAHGQVIQWPN